VIRHTCTRCDTAIEQPAGRGRRRKYCCSACKDDDRKRGAPWADEPFAQAVRAPIAAHGPLRSLQRQLTGLGWPVSSATISNWQTGRTLPTDTREGRSRVMALESALDLPSGQLMRAWQDSRLRGASSTDATRAPSPAARLHATSGELYNKETRKNAMIRRVEAAGGWLSLNYLVATAVEEDYLLGPDGLPLRSAIALTVYALRPGIDRYWYMYAFRDKDPGVDVRITPQAGCRLGDNICITEEVPPTRTVDEVVMATELRIEPLQPFAMHRLSYTVDYIYKDNNHSRYLRPEFIRVVHMPGTRHLRLSITFDNRALPRTLTRCIWKPDPDKPDGGFDTPVFRQDMPPNRPDRLVLSTPRTPAGYGWTWTELADRLSATRSPVSSGRQGGLRNPDLAGR
jgi:hypothetical protein